MCLGKTFTEIFESTTKSVLLHLVKKNKMLAYVLILTVTSSSHISQPPEHCFNSL